MFEWDEQKRQRNLAVRGIDFADMTGVLDDPARVEIEDTRRDYGERRFLVLCPVNGRLFHVTYTVRGQNRRIISARKANQKEHHAYERHRAHHQGRPHP